jgi:hypothetical protein
LAQRSEEVIRAVVAFDHQQVIELFPWYLRHVGEPVTAQDLEESDFVGVQIPQVYSKPAQPPRPESPVECSSYDELPRHRSTSTSSTGTTTLGYPSDSDTPADVCHFVATRLQHTNYSPQILHHQIDGAVFRTMSCEDWGNIVGIPPEESYKLK